MDSFKENLIIHKRACLIYDCSMNGPSPELLKELELVQETRKKLKGMEMDEFTKNVREGKTCLFCSPDKCTERHIQAYNIARDMFKTDREWMIFVALIMRAKGKN